MARQMLRSSADRQKSILVSAERDDLLVSLSRCAMSLFTVYSRSLSKIDNLGDNITLGPVAAPSEGGWDQQAHLKIVLLSLDLSAGSRVPASPCIAMLSA